jgi:hypothetical protein
MLLSLIHRTRSWLAAACVLGATVSAGLADDGFTAPPVEESGMPWNAILVIGVSIFAMLLIVLRGAKRSHQETTPV